MILHAFIAVFVISLVSLVGGLGLVIGKFKLKTLSFMMVALAAGTLIGDVVFHILPELYEGPESAQNIGLAIVAGVSIFFVLEKFLHWHHHENDSHANHVHVLAWNNLVGDALHNFIDGVIIAAAFTVSLELGVATAIAVALHELPQEIGDLGVLIHAGFSVKKALLLNLASALFAVVGLVTFYTVPEVENASDLLLAFAGGGFLYIALADLVPELQTRNKLVSGLAQIATVLAGLVLMLLLSTLE